MITRMTTSDMTASEYSISEITGEYVNRVRIWRVFYIAPGTYKAHSQEFVDCTSKDYALDTLADKWEQYEDWYRWADAANQADAQDLDRLSWFFYIEERAIIANIYKF